MNHPVVDPPLRQPPCLQFRTAALRHDAAVCGCAATRSGLMAVWVKPVGAVAMAVPRRCAVTLSIVDAALEIDAPLGVVLVTDHFGVHRGQIEIGGPGFAAAGDDHLGLGRFAQ